MADEAVASNLFGYTGHDDFVHEGRDEEGDEGGEHFARVRPGGGIDVSAEEGVDGDVPFAGEFHPVGRVPPVCVKVAVGEAGDFGKGAEDVLKDDEEDEQEGEHKGEEEPGDGFGEDEEGVRERWGGRCGGGAETVLGVDEDGEDELLGDNGQEEDAAKGGDDLGIEGCPVDAGGAGVLELVAESWAEEVVDVVGPGEVEGVGGVAHGRGEFAGEGFAENLDLVGGPVSVAVAVAAAQHGAFLLNQGGVHGGWDAGDAIAPEVGRRVDVCRAAVGRVGGRVEGA